MKHVAILGSTGSIGLNALEVVRRLPGRFKVEALSAHSNVSLLLSQIREFHPHNVCVGDEAAARELKKRLPSRVKLFVGRDGLEILATLPSADIVLLAVSGSEALFPLVKAVESGKQIALANKEALVMAGEVIMERVASCNAKIIPIDSEQSAIWQCLEGKAMGSLKQIYLTASGGPLRTLSVKALRKVSLKKVLAHPRWKMGKKITVDSATLMNKGLELLEAVFLFGVSAKKIKVLIHPEAIIHSMVEFIDGVVLAQLSVTDMRIPIQFALSFPARFANELSGIDFCALGALHFEKPKLRNFPCLGLAYQVASELGTSPAVLNAANEVCVGAFLSGRLKFISIPAVIERVLAQHHRKRFPTLSQIQEADCWARQKAFEAIRRYQ